MDKLVEREAAARNSLSTAPAIAVQFFLIPLLVVGATVLVYIGFRSLLSEDRSAEEYLADIAGTGTINLDGAVGPIGGVVRCQRCTGRWHGGCVTKRWCGGSRRSSSGNCAHLESDKVVLGKPPYCLAATSGG